jgi:hypothetical protein
VGIVKSRAVLLLFIVVIFCLSACKPSPVSEAKAEAIRKRASQDAADQEQARDHREDAHQTSEVENEALAGAWVFAKQCIILWGAANTMLIITAAAVGLGFALVGTGQATAIRAKTRARLIPLNAKTRQFPLIPFEAGGKVRIYNPNTDSVTAVGAIQAPNSQMITASGAVQLAGAIAQEAAQAAKFAARTDPGGAAGGVAGVHPPLVLAGEYRKGESR